MIVIVDVVILCMVIERRSEIVVDKRIMHTKYFLKNALIELMKTKMIGQITTTELCRAANVNRNTFYSHYSTPEQVLHEIEAELLDEVEEILQQNADEQKLVGIYQHFKENKELYQVFIKNRSSQLSKKMLELCKKSGIYRKQYLGQQDEKMWELFYLYSSSGSMEIVNDWILHDCTMPIEELQRIIDLFALYGLSAFQTK